MMIELPEALNLSKELKDTVKGKTVKEVNPPTKEHKFCFFNGDVNDYNKKLSGKTITSVNGFGIYVEIEFSDKTFLCFNDGVNVRYIESESKPKNYQLYIAFTDNTGLAFTVAMYGGIALHKADFENEYYIKSKNSISPFSADFETYYYNLLSESKDNLSAKAFLATGQRFPGIGNGALQDILFVAGINPKRKLSSFSDKEKDKLFSAIISTLKEMTAQGGRDTEKDIFGNCGGYKTKMSKLSFKSNCPLCKNEIKKETYLGGSVYYCEKCQKIK